MVDRLGDLPPYRQIAAALRESILSGELPPGVQLPSEPQLMRDYGVDRGVVRRALDILRREGRITTRHGRGSFVREQHVLRRLQADLLTRSDRRGWNAALDSVGRRPRVIATVSRAPAPEPIAELLGVDPATPVLHRARVMGEEGGPVFQLATSYIPMPVVERAPQLAEQDTGTGGMLTRLEEAGYVLHFEELISARMPLPEERRALALEEGVPVLRVIRITLSQDEEPLDVMERVIAADKCELAYRFGPEVD